MKRNKTENVGIWNIISSKSLLILCDEVVWLYLSLRIYIKNLGKSDGKTDDLKGASPQNPRPLHQNHLQLWIQTESTMLSFNPYCPIASLRSSSWCIWMESTTLIEYMVPVQAWGHCVSTSYKRLSKFIFWLECTIHATDPCNPICSTNTVALQEGFSTLGLLNGCDSLPQHSLTKPQRYPNISPDLIWCSPFFFFGTLAQNSSVPHSLEDCHSHNLATMVQPPHGKEILVSLGFFSWLASTSECERLLSLIKICYHHLTQQADGLWPPPFMKKLRGLRYWNQGRMTRKIINRDL